MMKKIKALILAALFFGNALAHADSIKEDFTYLQIGLANLTYDDRVWLQMQGGVVGYKAISGLNLAASWRFTDLFFVFLENDLISVNDAGTEVNESMLAVGGGVLLELGQSGSTAFAPRVSRISTSSEFCSVHSCDKEETDGTGIEAMLHHKFSHKFSVEAGVQQVRVSGESFNVPKFGFLYGGKQHGFYFSYRDYENASRTTLAYRYTF